jgi:hypothetical protein
MSNVENIVMARVHRIHTLRQFINPTLLKVYGAAVLFGALASFVSVANVYQNMPSLLTPSQFVTFMMNAFSNTELIVQLLLVGFAIVAALMIADMVRMARSTRTNQHLTHA